MAGLTRSTAVRWLPACITSYKGALNPQSKLQLALPAPCPLRRPWLLPPPRHSCCPTPTRRRASACGSSPSPTPSASTLVGVQDGPRGHGQCQHVEGRAECGAACRHGVLPRVASRDSPVTPDCISPPLPAQLKLAMPSPWLSGKRHLPAMQLLVASILGAALHASKAAISSSCPSTLPT